MTMNLSSVEQCDAIVAVPAKNERQLGSGEQHTFDVDLRFDTINDRKQSGARFRKKNSRDQFGEIFFVNVILVFRLGHDELDSFTRENLLIKTRLHRVTSPEKREAFEVSLLRIITGRFDDADERNRRSRFNLVEDNVRSVRGDDSKLGAGARKLVDFAQQKIGHAGEIVRLQKIDPLLQVDAVDDELRIMAIRLFLPIQRDDVFVIINRALRPDTGDHAQGFHRVELGFLIQADLLRSTS